MKGPSGDLDALKKSTRAAFVLSAGGILIMGAVLAAAIWRNSRSDNRIESANRKLAAVESAARHDDKTLREVQKFLSGQSESVIVAPFGDFNGTLIPKARYEYGKWRYKFYLGISVPTEVRSHIKRVSYQFDPEFYGFEPIDGTGDDFTAAVTVTSCHSKVNATIEFETANPVTVSFDWCKLSGWATRTHYDATNLGQIQIFPPDCSKSKVLLQFASEALLSRIGPLQVVRQLYRVDERWQPKSTAPSVQFFGLRSLRDPKQIAILAQCRMPEICVNLGAAYYALMHGMPPELHCGNVPLLADNLEAIPILPKGSLAHEELQPKSVLEECYRLSACEVASIGYTAQYSIAACNAGEIAKRTIECSRAESCDEVLTCAKDAKP